MKKLEQQRIQGLLARGKRSMAMDMFLQSKFGGTVSPLRDDGEKIVASKKSNNNDAGDDDDVICLDDDDEPQIIEEIQEEDIEEAFENSPPESKCAVVMKACTDFSPSTSTVRGAKDECQDVDVETIESDYDHKRKKAKRPPIPQQNYETNGNNFLRSLPQGNFPHHQPQQNNPQG